MLLGEYEAWHHDAACATKDGGRAARYVIPTRSGKVEITCTASAGAAVEHARALRADGLDAASWDRSAP